jgi:hypothetical protein
MTENPFAPEDGMRVRISMHDGEEITGTVTTEALGEVSLRIRKDSGTTELVPLRLVKHLRFGDDADEDMPGIEVSDNSFLK